MLGLLELIIPSFSLIPNDFTQKPSSSTTSHTHTRDTQPTTTPLTPPVSFRLWLHGVDHRHPGTTQRPRADPRARGEAGGRQELPFFACGVLADGEDAPAQDRRLAVECSGTDRWLAQGRKAIGGRAWSVMALLVLLHFCHDLIY